jgi:hypothetical protein
VGEFHYFHHGIDYETEPSARYKYDTLVLEAAQEVRAWIDLYKLEEKYGQIYIYVEKN